MTATKTAMKKLDYVSGACPKWYRCSLCKATNCKLWRQYQTLADHIKLLCLPCAEKDQKQKSTIEEGGSDQVGWLVAAVPTQDGDTYWGYTSIPSDGCDWWDNLPFRPDEKPPLEVLSPYLRKRLTSVAEARDFYKAKLGFLVKEAREAASEGRPITEDILCAMEYFSSME